MSLRLTSELVLHLSGPLEVYHLDHMGHTDLFLDPVQFYSRTNQVKKKRRSIAESLGWYFKCLLFSPSSFKGNDRRVYYSPGELPSPDMNDILAGSWKWLISEDVSKGAVTSCQRKDKTHIGNFSKVEAIYPIGASAVWQRFCSLPVRFRLKFGLQSPSAAKTAKVAGHNKWNKRWGRRCAVCKCVSNRSVFITTRISQKISSTI